MVIQCLECLCDLVLVLTDNCDDIISAHHILKYLHGSAACSDYIAKDIQDILALKGADDCLLVHDILFLYIVKVLKLEFLECSLVCLIIPVNS